MEVQTTFFNIKDFEKDGIEIIRYFEQVALQNDPRGYCVHSSWGKDSMASIKLFERAGVKFFVQWNITGIDPPELTYFGREQAQTLEDKGITVYPVYPEKSMCQMIVDHCTPPSALMRYCCEELKERRIEENNNCLHSFGVRWEESPGRAAGRQTMEVVSKQKQNIMLFSDNHENRKQFEICIPKGIKTLNPIISWSESLIWEYHHEEKIPHCYLYECGFDRLGCVGCPLATTKKRKFEFEAYPKFKAYYIRAFERMVIERKRRGVDEKRIAKGLNPMPFDTAENTFEWWINREASDKETQLEDQTEMELYLES